MNDDTLLEDLRPQFGSNASRIINAFLSDDITTVGQVRNMTDWELKLTPNIGKLCIKIIREVIGPYKGVEQ